MKPQKLIVPHTTTNSFSIRKEQIPNINNRWHCHTEVELICFHKGGGTQFVGDNIKRFAAGDIVLVGSNLPHYWRYDLDSEDNGKEDSYSTVLHFNKDFMGEGWLNLPEFRSIRSLLATADRGILIKEIEIANHINRIYESDGFKRVMYLLECLQMIASIKSHHLLSSVGFEYKHSVEETDRLNNIYNYTLKHFKSKINLEDVATIADLVPSSFCRYFKHRTGKTYTQFLQNIRIGYACKLLLENHDTIKQICYDSGFTNYTSFHEIFKSVTGRTPKVYQKLHLSSALV
ncbi:AraC family transcriptional regulator [Olivibacter domesticus]|uniref:AraC-type DNA-binding protein n=1 Tax=Olivibacter domesticus TaxID=407022 RepID=A0A1H7J192_OLID1|nr:AraC family transcriptional regulator [Olivibacter domesticus]SEK68541.1 AraC-type DNA-binding protein [Olivibacter domesticus]